MRSAILFLTVILTFTSGIFSQSANTEIRKIDAEPSQGFTYPYYLFVPSALTAKSEQERAHSIIVIPNNTGRINDDLDFHEADVKRKIPQIGAFLAQLKAPVLVPVFPRPATDHNLYTHSLDRDVFLTDKKEYKRLDLQLIAMIKNARGRLKTENIRVEEKILMQGYSASGMFVNRFVFLHPELVKAAAIGAPGGWPTAPVSTFQNKELSFPAGVADLKAISGRRFDAEKVRKVPMFFILGEKDTNDAVPMGDAYDSRESDLVIGLFGKTPVERWSLSQRLYREAGLNAEFKLYPDTTHQMSAAMRDDILAFIRKHAL